MYPAIVGNLLKYFLEGLAVALAAFYIPKRDMDMKEVAMIAATAGLTFLVLDMFAPSVGTGARFGSGFGIGANTVGFRRGGAVPAVVVPVEAFRGGSCGDPRHAGEEFVSY